MPPPRTGTIIQLPSGRFRVLHRLPDGTRRTVGICDTEDDAEVLRKTSLRVLEKEAPDGTNTLRAYGMRWVRARTSRDQAGDEGRWLEHVDTDPIARMAIRSIQRFHVEDFVKRLWSKKSRRTGKQLATSTIKNVRNLVSMCLNDAYSHRLVKHNAALGVRVGTRPRTEEEWHYARPAEQAALVAAAPDAFIRRMVVFAMTSGIRAGELCALRLADCHDDHVVIRYGGTPDAPTKGGRVRTVYLSAEARGALRETIASIPSYTATKRHPEGRNSIGLAFPGKRGAYRDEAHVIKWDVWQAMIDKAGLSARGFRWHDLRHTCGTSLACGWWGEPWDLIKIRDHLGHQQIATTERYAKIAAEELRAAASKTTGGPGGGPKHRSGGKPARTRPPHAKHPAREMARIGSRLDHAVSATSRNRPKTEPPSRLELETYGLRTRGDSREKTTVFGRRDPEGSDALALALLRAVARGDAYETERLRAVVAPSAQTIRGALLVAEATVARAPKAKVG